MATQVKKGYLRGALGSLFTPLNADGSLPSVVAEVKASANTGVEGNNNALTWTAKTGLGASGNQIVVILQNPNANSQSLAVTVYQRAILIDLATDGAGAITSTAAQVKAAIEANADANALVDVTHTGASTGVGVVVDQTAHLIGGSDQQGANYWIKTPEQIAYTMKVEVGAEDTLRGGDQVLTSVKDPDIVKGVTLNIKDARFDAKLAEIVDGGTLIVVGAEIKGYIAPTIAAQATPVPFRIKIYIQSFDETGHREAYLEYTFVYCIGKLGNITHADKTWSATEFNIDASENPSTLESVYSKQFVDTLPAEAG